MRVSEINRGYRKTEDTDKLTMIAEDYLGMLITVISERMLVGKMDSKNFLRRFIIHRLCVGNIPSKCIVLSFLR
jgi:uridylate kinase